MIVLTPFDEQFNLFVLGGTLLYMNRNRILNSFVDAIKAISRAGRRFAYVPYEVRLLNMTFIDDLCALIYSLRRRW